MSPKKMYNTFNFVFPSNMVINLVARDGMDDHQLVPNEEYTTSKSFGLEFNPNGHEIKVTDSWFGEVEPDSGYPDPTGLYYFYFQIELAPSGIGAEAPRVITIKDLSDSGSTINFTYDKTPKFREQETPHVYFDTVASGEGTFSKNVTVNAHTEYTAHINGKIEERIEGLNALFLTLTTDSGPITGATWDEARDAYAAGENVILCGPNPGTYILCDGASENYLSFSDVQWLSDGRVGRK